MKTLLMGGQACVLYGAAQFSRDLDLLILVSQENIERLGAALAGLDAVNIAVPKFESGYLGRGHAVHFRCRHPEVAGLRIDVMSVLRNVEPFERLWERRTTLVSDGEEIDLLSLEDLVAAKLTQRDKDWSMVRRLVEQDYFSSDEHPGRDRRAFWLRRLRTPGLLIAAANDDPELARSICQTRPAVCAALEGAQDLVQSRLDEEERSEKEQDAAYWRPLRQELEQLRRSARE